MAFTISDDLAERLLEVLNDIRDRLKRSPITLESSASTSISSVTELPQKLTTLSRSFTGHEFIVPDEPVELKPHRYNIQHKYDFVLFYSDVEIQAEFDKQVTSQTPPIQQYIVGQFELAVNESIWYKMSDAFYQRYGITSGKLYIFGFWY